jgi:hypothetical protein
MIDSAWAIEFDALAHAVAWARPRRKNLAGRRQQDASSGSTRA